MDTAKTQAASDRVYEDFEPYHEWARDEGRFTVMLPGYRRDQLKVQVTSKPALKLIGERLIIGDRWRRFSLEFPLPFDYDTDDVTATFEGGKLSIKFGKLIKPKETTTAPTQEAPKPQEPSQKVDEQKTTQEEEARTNEVSDQKAPQKTAQEDTLEAKQDKEEEARTNEVSDQKTPQKTAQEDTPEAKQDKEEARTDEVSDQKTPQKDKRESINEMEKSKTKRAASMEKVTEEVTEKTKAAISKAPKTKATRPVTRSITRLIDFTLCFEPSNRVDNEGLGDLTAGFNKWKKLVKWGMLLLLVMGLGLYTRNAHRSSHGEWNFQEL